MHNPSLQRLFRRDVTIGLQGVQHQFVAMKGTLFLELLPRETRTAVSLVHRYYISSEITSKEISVCVCVKRSYSNAILYFIQKRGVIIYINLFKCLHLARNGTIYQTMNIPMPNNLAIRSAPQHILNGLSIASIARFSRNAVKKSEKGTDKPKSLLEVIEQSEKRERKAIVEEDMFPPNIQKLRIVIPCEDYAPDLPSSKTVKKSTKEKISLPNKPIVIQQQKAQQQRKIEVLPFNNSFWFEEEQDKKSLIDEIYDQPSRPAGKKMTNCLEQQLDESQSIATSNKKGSKAKIKKKKATEKKPTLMEVPFTVSIQYCEPDKQHILPSNTCNQPPSPESPSQKKNPLLTYKSQQQQPEVIIIDRPRKSIFLTGKATLIQLVQELYKKKLINQGQLKNFTARHKSADIHHFLDKFEKGTLNRFPYKTIQFTLLDHRRMSELLKNLFPSEYEIGPVGHSNFQIDSYMNKMYKMTGEDYYKLYTQIDQISKVKWFSKILMAQESKLVSNFQERKNVESKAIKANQEVQKVLAFYGAKLKPQPRQKRSSECWSKGKKKIKL